MGTFDGKVAIVTGGGNGIGRACALQLGAGGASVVVADLRSDDAAAVASELTSAGVAAAPVACDVSREGDVESMVSIAIERFGSVDVLVTSAGIYTTLGEVHELTLADWQRVIDVNLTGTFLCIKHVLRPMLAAGSGSIVTIGSISSVIAGGNACSYQASKGGVLQLTRKVAAQYAARGIRANCVCPGSIVTDLRAHVNQSVMPHASTHSAVAAATLSYARPEAPMLRRGEPSEVASVVAFVASSAASFMTASVVMVDGGFTAI